MRQQPTKQQETKPQPLESEQKETIFKIRVTAEVLETAAGTRQIKVGDLILTFSREPTYLSATELPEVLTTDPYLIIETVDRASLPPGTVIIELKAERVQ